MHSATAPWYLWPIGFMVLAVLAVRIGLWLARLVMRLISKIFIGAVGAAALYVFLHRQPPPVPVAAVVEIPAVKMSPFAR